MININRKKLAQCVALLGEIFSNNASLIDDWWEWPHPSLGNKKPREAMVDGDICRVIRILKDMKNEEPS